VAPTQTITMQTSIDTPVTIIRIITTRT